MKTETAKTILAVLLFVSLTAGLFWLIFAGIDKMGM